MQTQTKYFTIVNIQYISRGIFIMYEKQPERQYYSSAFMSRCYERYRYIPIAQNTLAANTISINLKIILNLVTSATLKNWKLSKLVGIKKQN